MSLSPLLYVYATVLILNTIISGLLWVSYRESLFKLLFFFWISAVGCFASQCFYHGFDLPGFCAYATNGASVYFLAKIFGTPEHKAWRGLDANKALLFFGTTASLTLYAVQMDFRLVATAFSLSCAVILFKAASKSSALGERSALTTSHRCLIFLNGLHFLAYPFLRTGATSQIAFLIALAFFLCYSVLMPLLISRRLSDLNMQRLEDLIALRTRSLDQANAALRTTNHNLFNSHHELERVSSENRFLLGVLVHDLANPLSVAVGTLATLNKTHLPQETVKKLERIERAAVSITRTVTRARDFYSSELGKVPGLATVVDLERLIEQTIADFADQLSGKDLKIRFQKPDVAAPHVEAEEDRLRQQVLSNLLSNAIKFSHPGGTIDISLYSDQTNAFIKIRDFGVGIPKDKASQLFKFSGPTTTLGTKGEKGTGLGLPIVHHSLRHMGGSIRLVPPSPPPLASNSGETPADSETSDQALGTCFQISLPKVA